MAQYIPNGVTIVPALTWDNALTFVIGLATSTGTPLALVANPTSTTPLEALTLSSAGALTFPRGMTISTSVTMSTGGFTFSTGGTPVQRIAVLTLAAAPAAVPASSSTANRVEKLAVTGLSTSDVVLNVGAPASYAWAGISLGQCYVSSSGALGMPWINTTTAAVTPSTGTFYVTIMRTTATST